MSRRPKEMLYEEYFPKKENMEMPDDIWQTYAIETWGLNSFNALEGYYRRLASNPLFENHFLRIISKDDAERTCQYLERAQRIIWELLDETGRLDRLTAWEYAQSKTKKKKGKK